MKIVYYPDSSPANKYVDIIINGLKSNNISIYNLNKVLKNIFLFFQIKIFHFNWYEGVGSYKTFILKLLTISLLVVTKKKIIITLHNKKSHSESYAQQSFFLLRYLIKVSNKIIIHSHSSKQYLIETFKANENKIIHIPHPDYIDAYGPIETPPSIGDKNLKILFFGAIKPYKNIELLISVFNELKDYPIELLITGKPESDGYANFLADKIINDKISLKFQFIKDNDIPSIISNTDIVILPYNVESSLNSGSVILAFSYKKTVICPLIGTIADLQNFNNVYTYNYTDEKSHHKVLKEKVILCLSERADLAKKNEQVFANVMSNNNKQDVIKYILDTYEK